MHPIPRPHRTAVLGLLVAAACAPTPTVQPSAQAGGAAAESGGFVTRIGADTLIVERFTRTADRLEGEVVVRNPVTATRRYTARLRPDGSISRFEITLQTLGRAEPQPPSRITIEPGTDSATVRTERRDSVQVTRVAAGTNAFPSIRSYAIYEQALRHLRATGGDSAALALVPFAGRNVGRLVVRSAGGDSVTISDIAGPARGRVDARGRLMGVDATMTTFKVTVDRVPGVDTEALAADFAQRDRAGRGLGTLSPMDSVRVATGGANLAVVYGRPLRRGRTIMGGVVPWGEVWRTGANEATLLRTDRDLVVGGTAVPAGSYTLWTVPGPQGWKLILNRRTGQWGTSYDPAYDLAQVDMAVERVPEAVEQFTIGIDPRGSGGVLWMAWENTRASVPFTVK